MAEQAAKFEAEPRREPPPVVPRPPAQKIPRHLLPAPPIAMSPIAPPAARPQPAAARPSPLPKRSFPRHDAQYTARTPAHLGLPDVSRSRRYRRRNQRFRVPHTVGSRRRWRRGLRCLAKAVNGHNAVNGHKPANGHKRVRTGPGRRDAPRAATAVRPPSRAVPIGDHRCPGSLAGRRGGAPVALHSRDDVARRAGDGGGAPRSRCPRSSTSAGRCREPAHRSIETLSLSLYGTGDAFEIERLSERTQFVGGSSRSAAKADRWAWHVTPQSPARRIWS